MDLAQNKLKSTIGFKTKKKKKKSSLSCVETNPRKSNQTGLKMFDFLL